MNFVSRTPLRRALAGHIGGKEEVEKKRKTKRTIPRHLARRISMYQDLYY